MRTRSEGEDPEDAPTQAAESDAFEAAMTLESELDEELAESIAQGASTSTAVQKAAPLQQKSKWYRRAEVP